MALVRARKRVVSLLSDSRAGRALLLSALGDMDVAAVLDTLSHVVSAFAVAVAAGRVAHAPQPVDAEASTRATIKLAGKLFVLIRSGSVAPRDLVPLQLPVVLAGAQLASALEPSLRAGGAASAGVLQELSASVAAVTSALLTLATGRLKAASTHALAQLGLLYASPAFLEFMLASPAVEAPRAQLAKALLRVVRRSPRTAGAHTAGGSVTRRSRHTVPADLRVVEWPAATAVATSYGVVTHSTPAAAAAVAHAPAPPCAAAASASVSPPSAALQLAVDDHRLAAATASQPPDLAASSASLFPARNALASSPAMQSTLALVSVLARPAWAGAAQGTPPALLAEWLAVPDAASAFTAYIADLAFVWRAKRALGESVGDYTSDPPQLQAPVRDTSNGSGGHAHCDAPNPPVVSGDSDFVSSTLPCDPRLLLELCRAIADYRSVSNRALRAQRGCALFAKYLQRRPAQGPLEAARSGGGGGGCVASSGERAQAGGSSGGGSSDAHRAHQRAGAPGSDREADEALAAALLAGPAVVAVPRPASSYVPLPDAVYAPVARRMGALSASWWGGGGEHDDSASQDGAGSDPHLFDGVQAHVEGGLLQGLYAHAGPGGFRASPGFEAALLRLRAFAQQYAQQTGRSA